MKYNIDEKVFNEKTIISSYWAGFIAADGCIRVRKHGQKNLVITLAKKDREHLEKFKAFLKSDKPIYNYKSGACSFEISNDKIIYDLLNNFNITENKTFTLKSPALEGDLALSFIVGYIDGDGCFYINKRDNQIDLSITGTEFILRFVEKNINQLLNIDTKRKLYDKNNNEIYSIRWGKQQCRKIIDSLENLVKQLPVLTRKWSIAFYNAKKYKIFNKSRENYEKTIELLEQGKSVGEIKDILGYKSDTSIRNFINKKYKWLKT
jgi:phage gp36-like protein